MKIITPINPVVSDILKMIEEQIVIDTNSINAARKPKNKTRLSKQIIDQSTGRILTLIAIQSAIHDLIKKHGGK